MLTFPATSLTALLDCLTGILNTQPEVNPFSMPCPHQIWFSTPSSPSPLPPISNPSPRPVGITSQIYWVLPLPSSLTVPMLILLGLLQVCRETPKSVLLSPSLEIYPATRLIFKIFQLWLYLSLLKPPWRLLITFKIKYKTLGMVHKLQDLDPSFLSSV